jgi:hypothetical protein
MLWRTTPGCLPKRYRLNPAKHGAYTGYPWPDSLNAAGHDASEDCTQSPDRVLGRLAVAIWYHSLWYCWDRPIHVNGMHRQLLAC